MNRPHRRAEAADKSPNAKYQAKYRERYVRRGKALEAIVTKLDGNDKPLAVELRGIAEEGLK